MHDSGEDNVCRFQVLNYRKDLECHEIYVWLCGHGGTLYLVQKGFNVLWNICLTLWSYLVLVMQCIIKVLSVFTSESAIWRVVYLFYKSFLELGMDFELCALSFSLFHSKIKNVMSHFELRNIISFLVWSVNRWY